MLTTATGGALIDGAPPTGATMTRIKALRSFYLAGEEIQAGREVLAADALARELIAANKAAAVRDPVVMAPEPVAQPEQPAKARRARAKE
jgi:hypothetical protein